MVSTLMISMMKIKKLMRHGCEAYLVFVSVAIGEKNELSELPIVQVFPMFFWMSYQDCRRTGRSTL